MGNIGGGCEWQSASKVLQAEGSGESSCVGKEVRQ